MSVQIKPLLDIAEELQGKRHNTDTELFLYSTLYQSFESWTEAFNENPSPAHEKMYWLSFDSFHAAQALILIVKESPDGLDKIHSEMKRVMDEYKPSDMVVKL